MNSSLIRGLKRAADRVHAYLLGGSGVRSRRQRSRFYLRRGMRHMLKDEFFEAVVEYKAAVEQDPTDVYAVVNRGTAWLYLKDFEMALADFETGMRLDPECWFPYLGRGYIRLSLGDPARAQEDFSRALKLLDERSSDKKPVLHCHRANCFLALEDDASAESEADACLTLSPENAEARSIRGWARLNLGKLEQAVEDFSEAIRIGPPTAYLFGCRGYARQLAGRSAEALADYEEVARLAPDDLRGQCYLGYLLGRVGDHFRARDHYERLLAAHPAEPLIKNNYAWLLATCRETLILDGARAVVLATAACELSEWKEPHYIETLAAAYAESGDFEQAVRLQTRALELFTENQRESAIRILEEFRAGRPYRDPSKPDGSQDQ